MNKQKDITVKINHLPIFLFLSLLGFFACKKESAPILTGDIKGTVSLFDGYGYRLQDASGVQVQLVGDDISMEQQTDAYGHYLFEGLPFGNYYINLVKENFIENRLNFRLGHIGGDVPTLVKQTMNQIPEYWFSIDSLTYDGFNKLKIYLQAFDINKPFVKNTFLHCFFSQSPDVSAENFEDSFIEFGPEYLQDNLYYIYWIWYESWYNFLNDYTDTIYCRVYPQTRCDEMWFPNTSVPHEVFPETLGKPSEVFSFTLDEITREL